ncbi:MAG: PAS domain S-box protein, partial [Bacillota bacterium]|nr:PAS domain S-box protein [Bacillota bacterium]
MGVKVNIEDNGYLGIQKDSSIGYAYHRMLLDERGIPIDYVLLKTNTAYKQLIGISEDQILGRKFTELLSDQMKDELDYIEKFGRVALHNESFKFEFYSEPLNKWYLVSAFSVQYLCFTLMFHDITDTKNLVNKLQKANYLNEILLNAIPHPALLIRKDRKVIAANKIAREAGAIIGGYCWRDWGA